MENKLDFSCLGFTVNFHCALRVSSSTCSNGDTKSEWNMKTPPCIKHEVTAGTQLLRLELAPTADGSAQLGEACLSRIILNVPFHVQRQVWSNEFLFPQTAIRLLQSIQHRWYQWSGAAVGLEKRDTKEEKASIPWNYSYLCTKKKKKKRIIMPLRFALGVENNMLLSASKKETFHLSVNVKLQ